MKDWGSLQASAGSGSRRWLVRPATADIDGAAFRFAPEAADVGDVCAGAAWQPVEILSHAALLSNFGFSKARGRRIPAVVCNGRATQEKPKSDATRRARSQ